MDHHDDMISGLSIQRLEMHSGAVTKLQLAAGACLTNRQGKLWITRSNDSHDYWLMPGAGLSFPHAGMLLLEAYGDSALTIESRRPARSVMRWLSKVLHALSKLRCRWNSRNCTPHAL
ncbi:MAG: DUF2917 domain-containing protein [Glaciimonas sp.]|nr:DUF2917 domain-containing protein [Glaciimonas sp.]